MFKFLDLLTLLRQKVLEMCGEFYEYYENFMWEIDYSDI